MLKFAPGKVKKAREMTMKVDLGNSPLTSRAMNPIPVDLKVAKIIPPCANLTRLYDVTDSSLNPMEWFKVCWRGGKLTNEFLYFKKYGITSDDDDDKIFPCWSCYFCRYGLMVKCHNYDYVLDNPEFQANEDYMIDLVGTSFFSPEVSTEFLRNPRIFKFDNLNYLNV